jgi:FdhE protein
MTQVGTPHFDPIPIGDVAQPPFARLPDPTALFAHRAVRLEALAEGHELRPYVLFVAGVCDAQHRVQADLPEALLPPADAIARSREFKMPPLDRFQLIHDRAVSAIWEKLAAILDGVVMPESARLALQRVKAADPERFTTLAGAVIENAIPLDDIAEHVFVFAALQVHFARLAARLDAQALVPVGQGVCPACGSPPISTMIVGWSGAKNTRFCACSLCGTLWNYPRIKCVLCGSTEGISYQEIEGRSAAVKAETCKACHGYVKILHQHIEPTLDPVADDIATLALDLLLRQSEYRRGAVDPFLLGY